MDTRAQITLAATLISNLIMLVSPCCGSPGDLDLSFNPGSGIENTVQAIAMQSDGKALVAGDFLSVKGLVRSRIARLNSDGSGDPSFNPGTGANAIVYSVAVQTDGKILIAGNFTAVNGTNRNRIARLNTDGSLDSSFNPGTGADFAVYSMAAQTNGSVLIGGFFFSVNGTNRNRIARLNSDGSLDTTFDPGTGADQSVFSVAAQPDNKVLIGGAFTSVNGTNRNRIARLNADGSLDSSFDPGAGANSTIRSIAQSNGKVLIGGNFTQVNGIPSGRIARLNDNGGVDTNFNSGTGASGVVNSVAVQTDDKVLIGGNFFSVNSVSRWMIARLNPNGTVDASFSLGGFINTKLSGVLSVTVQSDGKVLVGGDLVQVQGQTRENLARLNSDASLDNSFIPGDGPSGEVHCFAVQSDNKILFGGLFRTVGLTPMEYVARLNDDATLDTSFNPGTALDGSVDSFALQPDGKVIIGGGFGSYNSMNRRRIARLNNDGSLDTGFNPGMGANGSVLSVALQTNGKVVVGGGFSMINGTNRSRVAQLNADGSLDASFDPGTGPDNFVYSLASQSDGKVVIGGAFSTVNGEGHTNIARLNTNGIVDSSFNPIISPSFSSVQTVVVQPDGKILLGGDFEAINGMTRRCIARLNDDGSLDTSFLPTPGATYIVNSVAVRSDGRIVIGGLFTSVNGSSRNRIALLNPNGSVDTSFDPGTGVGGSFPYVQSVAVQPDGKVLVGGQFSSINGTSRSYIARLLGDPPLADPALTILRSSPSLVFTWPTNVTGYKLQSATNLIPPVTWTDSTNVPARVGTQFMVTNTASGYGGFFRLKK